MRLTKLSAIIDCTKRAFSSLLSNEGNYHKFKYSTSVQIQSDMNNVLMDINKISKGLSSVGKTNKVVSSLKQRTLR